jgi:hypothetical protein
VTGRFSRLVPGVFGFLIGALKKVLNFRRGTSDRPDKPSADCLKAVYLHV